MSRTSGCVSSCSSGGGSTTTAASSTARTCASSRGGPLSASWGTQASRSRIWPPPRSPCRWSCRLACTARGSTPSTPRAPPPPGSGREGSPTSSWPCAGGPARAGRADAPAEGRRGHARLQRGPHAQAHVRGAAEGVRQPRDPGGRRLPRRDARDRAGARAPDLRPRQELRLRRQPEDLLYRGAQGEGRHRGHGPPRLSVRPDPRAEDDRAHRARRSRPRAGLAAQGRRLGYRAGHAVVEVPRPPLPDGRRARLLRSPPLRVPHGLPGLQSRGARGRELPDEFRRLRVRPGDHRAGRGGGLPHRRDRRARPVLRGGFVGKLPRLLRLRTQDPVGRDALLAPPERHQALAQAADAARSVQQAQSRTRDHRRQLRPLRQVWTGRLARGARSSFLLDLACALAGLAFLSTLVWWWRRPEDVFLVLLGLITLRLLVAPVALPALRPRRTLLVGVATYAGLFSFVTVTRHFTLHTHALDLGYYVQLTWNLARGAGPSVSLPEMNAWGDHFSPIMYLLAPLFWIAPGPVTLLVVQSVALALGALAVFGMAARRLGDERPAAAFAVLYLVNPSLHGINVRDFHAAALAIPLLLAAIYAAETRRPWMFIAASLLTLLCREDAALAVVGLGAWLAVGRGR